jgi:Domain of unknown function (DUF4253)
METFMTDYWPYVVGLLLSLTIYFVIFTALPFLFRKLMGSKPAKRIAASKTVNTMANVINPKPVFAFPFREVSGESAMAAFEAAKAEGKDMPVLIAGDASYRQSLADMAQYRKSTAEYLALADRFPDPFRFKTKPRMPKAWTDAGPLADDGHPFLVKNFDKGFKPVVTLAFIPAASSADIPAHLRLGGWNGVAEADIMVALFRNWQREYGAEIVALSLDAIDVRTTRKPATRQEALVLAREHLKFCATGATTAEGAAELMATNWWHFYWD